MVRFSTTRTLVVSGLLTLSLSATLSAQSIQAQAWGLQNLRARWCVYFLMDSVSADKRLTNDYQPRVANDFPGLSPAVMRLIHDEPGYSSWIPAQFCSSLFDQALVDSRAVGDSSTTPGDSQILVTWLIGATPKADTSGARPTYYVSMLRSDNWRLLRQGELWQLPGERAEHTVGKVPESTEDRYEVKLGRTIVTWEGHLAGDSAWSAPPVEERWFTQSARNARISAQASFHPVSAQSVAGVLRIVGKDDLAKSLRATPIRMVGPMMWGGNGGIDFSK